MSATQPKPKTRYGRTLRLLLAFAVALSGLVAVNASPAAAQLPPEGGCPLTTAPGQNIYRCEIMYRALTWYNIRSNSDMTYSQSLFHADYNNSDTYRRDCSGFVGMAWHLSADPNTAGLPSYGTKLNSWKDLKPGDMLNYPRPSASVSGHTMLFKEWNDAAHTSFDYYAFGSTPLKLVLNETITGGSDGKLDGRSYTVYTPYRRNGLRDI